MYTSVLLRTFTRSAYNEPVKKKKKIVMEWVRADDITREVIALVVKLNFDYIDCRRIICMRSVGSSSRARARIWSFPRVWQQALNLPACYIIEVLSQHFDRLSADDKKRVLIHELLHIPRNFSGSLVAHRGRNHRIDSRRVEQLLKTIV
jgi:predicted metallopeptidase